MFLVWSGMSCLEVRVVNFVSVAGVGRDADGWVFGWCDYLSCICGCSL